MPLSQYITLIDTMARFSLLADARRYFLGYAWWILEPFLYVAVFYLVFFKLLGTQQPDYLAFLVVGKLTFVWFSKSVNQAASSLVNARGLIGQRNMPKLVFPLAVLQEGVYKQLPVFGLLLGYLLIAGYRPTTDWLWLLPLLLVNYLLITVCGLMAALLVCVQRDFLIVINLGMVLMLFMSGVFWDVAAIPNARAADWLMTLNPLAFLLDAYRQVLLHNTVPALEHLAGLALISALGLAVAGWLYLRAHYWIARKVVTQ